MLAEDKEASKAYFKCSYTLTLKNIYIWLLIFICLVFIQFGSILVHSYSVLVHQIILVVAFVHKRAILFVTVLFYWSCTQKWKCFSHYDIHELNLLNCYYAVRLTLIMHT